MLGLTLLILFVLFLFGEEDVGWSRQSNRPRD
jgi:hypothetical protein